MTIFLYTFYPNMNGVQSGIVTAFSDLPQRLWISLIQRSVWIFFFFGVSWILRTCCYSDWLGHDWFGGLAWSLGVHFFYES